MDFELSKPYMLQAFKYISAIIINRNGSYQVHTYRQTIGNLSHQLVRKELPPKSAAEPTFSLSFKTKPLRAGISLVGVTVVIRIRNYHRLESDIEHELRSALSNVSYHVEFINSKRSGTVAMC